MTPILVTGGAGYIGSHTCKALARAGYLPVVYDNLVYGHDWAVQWGPLERGDLLDGARLAAVIARYRPVAAIHFAAYAYVGESVTDPAKYYANNVGGTLSLLAALRAAAVGRLVFSSTCATYGVPERLPLDERHPQRPVNPYGHSKRMIEQVLRDYDRAYGLRSIALRYFNAAGADPDGDLGEDHTPETHLIPLVLRAALDPAAPVSLHGDDYPTPDGTCIRDYIHVSDLADAHLRALAALERRAPTAAYNLGTGRGHSVLEVLAAARRVTGCDIPVVVGPRRAGDPPELVADAALAGVELGWQPQFTDLEATIATAWDWAGKHPSPAVARGP
ncbi:UDP-glucose 4-epimerase GalE [uncultured Thiodictyon sp.]|uniref:UDP-glucose 4-epimerase GalE n=1 Tax=uncultured Thiodictyon sp. TaxID=1846217 RepID=UPI0025DA1FFA|nr:UDP-glucose 4-epimerase GalE [uncultured Thiodictyon sp.]